MQTRRREAALCRMLSIEHEQIGVNSQPPIIDLVEMLEPVNDITARLWALSGLNVKLQFAQSRRHYSLFRISWRSSNLCFAHFRLQTGADISLKKSSKNSKILLVMASS